MYTRTAVGSVPLTICQMPEGSDGKCSSCNRRALFIMVKEHIRDIDTPDIKWSTLFCVFHLALEIVRVGLNEHIGDLDVY